MQILKKFQAYFAIQSKIKQADAMFQKTNKRHFVIPFNDGTIEVLSLDEALTLKKQHLLPSDLTAKTIYGASYYWTDTKSPHASVKGRMPQRERHRRRQVFYQWFFNHHQ